MTLRFSIGDSLGHRERLISMISDCRLAPASVVTHHLPLGEAVEAYRMFDDREATKIVMAP